ncbi:MAG TPA: hypothetical protein VF300_04425 [Methanothrix sp.]
MNKISISIILIISLIGCVSAAYGQSYGQSSAYPQPVAATGYAANAPGTSPQYSEYYTMPTGPKPAAHIIAPQKYAIESRTPAMVYFGNQMQAVQYSQYLSNPIYKQSNSLWIQGSTSWSQYAEVPQGAVLSIIAISATGGNGYLYEIYPDGKSSSNNYYFFPGANLIGFYADTVGQHTLLISVNGQASNEIVIDVVGSQPPAYQQPIYQQPTYQQPGYYSQPGYYQQPGYIYFQPRHPSHKDNDSPRDNKGNVSPRGH